MSFKLPAPVRNLLTATKFWQENRLIFREIRHFRWIPILATFFSIIAALTSGFWISLIGILLQSLTNPTNPFQTNVSWIDTWILGIQAAPSERIYRLGGLIIAITWVQAGFTYLGQLYSRNAALLLADRLRKSLFEQLSSLSLSFFMKRRAGDLMNSVRGETSQVQMALAVIAEIITFVTQIIVYLAMMLFLSWKLTTACIFAFGLLSVGISTITGKVREASFEVPKANEKFTSTALEFINGIRAVHASATQDFERRKFYTSSEDLHKALHHVEVLKDLVGPLTQGSSGTVLIMIVVGAFTLLVQDGSMQAATLLTFLLTLSRTVPFITRLNASTTKLGTFHGSFQSIKSLLSREDKPYLIDGKVPFEGLKQSIDFVSVDFGYDPDEPVLHDVTLSIQKGQTTALVGSSGAGKTTLVDLIPRFFDINSGEILVDGINLKDVKINTLRRKMAIVSQDTFIFNASVKDNVCYGGRDIEVDKVWNVLEQANALDFIRDLPNGLETMLGDRGVRLSGGQRQRIAIARALLRDPEILILDEATSALDSVTESLIQESLEQLSKGRTVIAIAHRLSTISQADKVIVLEQGRVIEQGSYQELLDRRQGLWKYHQAQYQST